MGIRRAFRFLSRFFKYIFTGQINHSDSTLKIPVDEVNIVLDEKPGRQHTSREHPISLKENKYEDKITMPMIKTSLIKGYKSFSFHREYMDINVRYEIKLDKQNINYNLSVKQIAENYVDQILDNLTNDSTKYVELSNFKKYNFIYFDIKTVPFNNHKIVKFIQAYQDDRVYDSLLVVELDEKKELVAINCTIGMLNSVDKENVKKPDEALDVVKSEAGYNSSDTLKSKPVRYIYFDDKKSGKWRLVYIVKQIIDKNKSKNKSFFPKIVDFVIDAQNLDVIDILSKA